MSDEEIPDKILNDWCEQVEPENQPGVPEWSKWTPGLAAIVQAELAEFLADTAFRIVNSWPVVLRDRWTAKTTREYKLEKMNVWGARRAELH